MVDGGFLERVLKGDLSGQVLGEEVTQNALSLSSQVVDEEVTQQRSFPV